MNRLDRFLRNGKSYVEINGVWTEVKLDTHELAWAAGFFDGEGCSACYVRKTKTTAGKISKSMHLYIQVSQNDDETLKRFHKAILYLGFVVYRNHYSAMKVDGIKVPGLYTGGYVFNANRFEECQAIMTLLWKYLSSVKKAQWRESVYKYHQALSEQSSTKMRRKHRNFIHPSPGTVNPVKDERLQPLLNSKIEEIVN